MKKKRRGPNLSELVSVRGRRRRRRPTRHMLAESVKWQSIEADRRRAKLAAFVALERWMALERGEAKRMAEYTRSELRRARRALARHRGQ